MEKIKESLLFSLLHELLIQKGFITPQELIGCGFSAKFADAWEKDMQSGLSHLALLGVEKIAGTTDSISAEEFQNSMRKTLSQSNAKKTPQRNKKKQLTYIRLIIGRILLNLQPLTAIFPVKTQYLVVSLFPQSPFFDHFPIFLLNTISCVADYPKRFSRILFFSVYFIRNLRIIFNYY